MRADVSDVAAGEVRCGPLVNSRLQLQLLQGPVAMVHFPIDCDVVAEVIVVHQATANVHPDLLQVGVVDDAVGIQVVGSQGYGGGSIDRAGDTVQTGHGHGSIGAVAVNGCVH